MFLGLGLPEWLTIFALGAALWATFKIMARAALAYERSRRAREASHSGTLEHSADGHGDSGPSAVAARKERS